jgi:hypothetical protein
MDPIDVYIYGMTVYSTIHLLKGPYPEADTYQEILQTWNIPSGEAAVGAVILSRLGLKVRLGGPHFGVKTQKTLSEHLVRFGVDTGDLIYDPSYEGLQELVLVDPEYRTVFGHYVRFLFGGERHWGPPNPDSIRAAAIVAIDPFFGEDSLKAGELCVQEGKPYVTIDCPPDGALHRSAAATVVSREYRKREHPGVEDRTLLSR